MGNVTVSVIVALAAVACVAPSPALSPLPSPEPLPTVGYDYAIPWSQEHFGTIAIFVDDQSDLVLGAEKLRVPMGVLGPGDFTAVADFQASTLAVSWMGGVCRFGPTVKVTGDAHHLVVSIRPEAGAGLPPGVVCNALGAFYGITLNLATPVEQDAVSVELIR